MDTSEIGHVSVQGGCAMGEESSQDLSNVDLDSDSSSVGTKLLFENDRIRVWDLCLEPGESIGLHRHHEDYCYIVIGNGALQRVEKGGEKGAVRKMKDGDVVFREISGEEVHGARNAGDGTWRNIVVEFKKEKRF